MCSTQLEAVVRSVPEASLKSWEFQDEREVMLAEGGPGMGARKKARPWESRRLWDGRA